MKYAILVYETAADIAARTDPAKAPAYWGAWGAFAKALNESGVAAGGNALQPHDTATTVRHRGGKQQIQDGPYADVKEQLGGMFVIDVPDLDTALKWAARCPSAATGAAEVRPIMVVNQGQPM